MKERVTKKVKTFRIEPALTPRVENLAKKIDRSQSWIINQALKKQLPELEKTAVA